MPVRLLESGPATALASAVLFGASTPLAKLLPGASKLAMRSRRTEIK